MITCGKQIADGDANWPNWFLGATTMGSNKGFSCFFPQWALVAIVCLTQVLPLQDTILSSVRSSLHTLVPDIFPGYLKSRTGAAGAAAKLVFCAEQNRLHSFNLHRWGLSLSLAWRPNQSYVPFYIKEIGILSTHSSPVPPRQLWD